MSHFEQAHDSVWFLEITVAGTTKFHNTRNCAMNPPDKMHPDMSILLNARDCAGFNRLAEAPFSIGSYRAFWSRYCGAIDNPRPDDIDATDEAVTVGDHAVPVRIYRTADLPEAAPCVIYLHGGGFMLGDLDSSDILAWGFTPGVGAVTISVDYRLTPEHPYPAALEDTYGVLAWVHDNAGILGIDPTRIALAGDSAGGCLTAAACIKSHAEDGPRIAAQAMIYQVAGVTLDAPSYIENADAVGLTTKAMKMFLENYLQSPMDWSNPLARPVLADREQLAGLPPAFIHTAQFDPIRDDGRIYAAKLAEAGCNVTYREVPGMIHGFYRARLESAAAAHEYETCCAFLRQELAEATP